MDIFINGYNVITLNETYQFLVILKYSSQMKISLLTYIVLGTPGWLS